MCSGGVDDIVDEVGMVLLLLQIVGKGQPFVSTNKEEWDQVQSCLY